MTAPAARSVAVPVHLVPETSSTERMHVLNADCWCRPNVVATPVDGLVAVATYLRTRTFHHRGQLRPGDRVAVDDPALAEVQRIFREALGEEPAPNNEGTVEQAWDDGTLLIFFDDGGSAPYPATDARRIA